MLYLIGLGLNEEGYSWKAYNVISKADKVYIESYTVDFPYDIPKLQAQFKNKKFIRADREFIESLNFLDEAKKSDIALLVYGSPLVATTHISILQEAKKRKIKLKIIHNASILDAVGETGLQLYKFGKTASMPGFDADSYMDIVKQNLGIKAHTLILVDIGLEFQDALEKLIRDSKSKNVKLDKMVVCSRLGLQDSKIYYDTINKLKSKNIRKPFCIIIPSEMHFMEQEILKNFG